MNYCIYKIFRKLRIFFPRIEYKSLACNTNGQQASDQIAKILVNNNAAMICRFGASELDYIENSLIVNKWHFKKYLKFLIKQINYLTWESGVINNMINWSGFFGHSNNNAKKYTKLVYEDAKEIDILGSWLNKEALFNKLLKKKIIIPLADLEPYFHENPWSEHLSGKKVLVIHPFNKSIEQQYLKRSFLFENDRVLPKFDLITLKSVQTIGGMKSDFNSWFEALEHMKSQISEIEFDVAIIGCGAYGFNLAAHIKRMGKIAIHLGGSVQILFGIKGRRWENIPLINQMFNSYWIRPLDSEKPQAIINAEDGKLGGHYW